MTLAGINSGRRPSISARNWVATAQRKLEQLCVAPKTAAFASRSEEIERRRIHYERAETELDADTINYARQKISAEDVEALCARAEVARRRCLADLQERKDREGLFHARSVQQLDLIEKVRPESRARDNGS